MAFTPIEWAILVIILFHFFVAGSVIIFVMMSRMRWPLKIMIMQNVAGAGYRFIKEDRARSVAFGDGGEQIIFLRRWKKYRVGYGKRVGLNTLLFIIAEDGYWYNVDPEDFDKKLLKLGFRVVDRDMRFSNSSIRKGIDLSYGVKTFFEKYGVPITIGMLILAMCVQGGFSFFNASKQAKIAESNKGAAEQFKIAAETQASALQSIANILDQAGGSGIRIWLPYYSGYS